MPKFISELPKEAVPIVVKSDISGGDINLYLDGLLVAYISGSSGKLHRLAKTGQYQADLAAKGIVFDEKGEIALGC